MIDKTKMSTSDYLKYLSALLMRVPAIYGTDQYDCERLREIAEKGDFSEIEECLCHLEDDFKYPCPIHDADDEDDT